MSEVACVSITGKRKKNSSTSTDIYRPASNTSIFTHVFFLLSVSVLASIQHTIVLSLILQGAPFTMTFQPIATLLTLHELSMKHYHTHVHNTGLQKQLFQDLSEKDAYFNNQLSTENRHLPTPPHIATFFTTHERDSKLFFFLRPFLSFFFYQQQHLEIYQQKI